MKKNQSAAEVDDQHRHLVESIINNDEKLADKYMSEHMDMIEKCIDEMHKINLGKRPGTVIGGE